MLQKVWNHWQAKTLGKLPLQTVLIVPFVVQVCLAVSITGYLSYRNGRQAINQLADQLLTEISDRIDHSLDDYLAAPLQINRLNLDAIQLGLLDLEDFNSMGRLFWRQMQIFDVGYINFGDVTGRFIGVERLRTGEFQLIETLNPAEPKPDRYYALDRNGNRTTLLEAIPFMDSREEGWYKDAAYAGRPVWSNIYQWEDKPEILSISSSFPIYDSHKKLLGVIGVDLLLTGISDDLRKMQISPHGETFILEPDGLLIASSTLEAPYILSSSRAGRLPATQSRQPMIRETARYLSQQFTHLNQIKAPQQLEFTLNGERQFVTVSPWQDKFGLNWLIVVVVPESDFMGQINAQTRTTLLLCLLALMLSILTGLMTARWVIRPILHLNQAAKALAAGDWEQRVRLERSDEVGQLAQAFNHMADQLLEAFATLEQRVADRTAELAISRDKAESANRTKTAFLANMTHELRTPLNAILGFTQILEQDQDLSAEQRANLQIINRSGEYLLDLINDVLQMSKIEAGRIEVRLARFDLWAMLENLRGLFQWRAQSKGLKLQLAIAPEVPQFIQTDESKLRQVLINLLGNALKFTQVGQVVLSICASPNQEHPQQASGQTNGNDALRAGGPILLNFAVEDTGCGIAPEDREQIFDAFFQSRNEKQSHPGTGLGLSISRNFVRLLGGQLQVQSQVGQGSTFSFILPVGERIAQSGIHSLSVPGLALADRSELSLSRLDLTVMPADWMVQLYHAAQSGDDEYIRDLIEQIPPEHARLVNPLLMLVDNFQFDAITALTQG